MLSNFRTYHLAVKLYREISLPEFPGHLKNQIFRSSSSVALNLAEGRGRKTHADQKHFFTIAFGSLRETSSILELANAPQSVQDLADVTSAHLYKLIRNLK